MVYCLKISNNKNSKGFGNVGNVIFSKLENIQI